MSERELAREVAQRVLRDWLLRKYIPAGDAQTLARALLSSPKADEVRRMREALEDAEAGLLFAGADKEIAEGDFVPAPTLALRAVRRALSDGKTAGPEASAEGVARSEPKPQKD